MAVSIAPLNCKGVRGSWEVREGKRKGRGEGDRRGAPRVVVVVTGSREKYTWVREVPTETPPPPPLPGLHPERIKTRVTSTPAKGRNQNPLFIGELLS
jgi:hypothetical protein